MESQSWPWKASAAYLYVLQLAPKALAWEYLRRNADYHREWETLYPASLRLRPHWGLKYPREPISRCTRRQSGLE